MRPQLEPHLSRLLTTEKIVVGSLFEYKSGTYWCSLYAPGTDHNVVLNPECMYAVGEGPTPDDAVYAARTKLWGTL